jgi:hypothetical protein
MKAITFKNLIPLASTAVSLSLLPCCVAHAAALPGSNALNSISYTFTETEETASLTLSGKVEADDNVPTFTVPATFWTATISLTLDEFVDDELFLSVTLQHIKQPHPAQDNGNGATFSDSFNVLAENYDDGSYSLNHNDSTLDHGSHKDRFYGNKFTFSKTTSLGILDFDEIPTWNYTLNATHAVPEPDALALLGAGGAIVAGAAWRRRARR